MSRAHGEWTAAAVYFAIVFLAGFVLGALRALVVAPWLGETLAVGLEAPVMLAVSWLVAAGCAQRFDVPGAPRPRLTMGAVAFGLLMTAELGVSLIIWHRSIAQHFAGYRSTAGALGLAAQVAFAGIPLAQTWPRWTALAAVRAVHTAIYLVMTASTFVVLYAGITGATGPWLWIAVALLAVESAVFLGNGLKCPLTAVAAKYGASGGADTFLPERFTRHTFRVFGPLILLAAALLAIRWGLARPG